MMPTPKIDFTINVSHLITFGGIIVTMVLGYASFDSRLKIVEETLRTSTATMVEQVKQNSELRALADRVARLERYMESRP